MPEVKPPDWLPDGWIMEVRVDNRNKTYRCYKCPESGAMFMSKETILCYLNGRSMTATPAKDVTVTPPPAPHQNVIDSLNWLPSGWLIEIRVPNRATKAGQYYKCYINKSTGIIFHSKEDVLNFQSTGECRNSVPGKETVKSATNYHVLMQIEYSPDDLPHGWIREIRFRWKNGYRTRDCYFTDPVSGYLFQSRKDVLRYVEDGILSNRAYQQKAGLFQNLFALEKEFHGDVKNEPMKIGVWKELPVSLPSSDCKSSLEQQQKKKKVEALLNAQISRRKKKWLAIAGSK